MAARRPHPEPYEPRRRREPGDVENVSETEPWRGDESPISWWEVPFVVLLAPVRWVGGTVAAVAEALASLADGAVRAVERVGDLLLVVPLRALRRGLSRPLRWLGRAAWSLLRTPAALLGAVGRWAGHGLTSVVRTGAEILAWAFRPAALFFERVLVAPVRLLVKTLARWWDAAGRLAALVWRAATWPVRSLAQAVSGLLARPFRRLGRRVVVFRAAVRARTARLQRAWDGRSGRLLRPTRQRPARSLRRGPSGQALDQ